MIDDEAFTALAAALSAMAHSRPPQLLNAATHEQVDLVTTLLRLAGQLKKFSAHAIAEVAPPDQWAALADLLADASRACRNQVVIDAST